MQKKGMIRKGYISELDNFLREFDRLHPNFCASRQQEIEKDRAIAAKRDGIVEKPKTFIYSKHFEFK